MFDRKRSRLLEICVVISLVVHTGFIAFLQNQCLWFSTSSVPVQDMAYRVEKIAADQILKEAFGELTAKNEGFSPKVENASSLFIHSAPVLNEPPPIAYSLPSVSFDEMLASQTTLLPIHFSLPTLEYLDLAAGLPKDLILPTPQRPANISFYQPEKQKISTEMASVESPVSLNAPEPALVFAKKAGAEIPSRIAKVLPSIPMPNLPKLPTLAELHTINLSDSFESDLTFFQKPDGSGYVFALTLVPHSELKLPTLRQNIVFLIDKSNSIQRDRLHATKTAVHKAIEDLEEQDRFNIISFDTKMDKAFPLLLNSSAESKRKAMKYIDGIELGSLFTLGDLHKPLFLTIPSGVVEDELYTAILLSDGESLSKKQSQRAFFRDWTLQNNGRVSLYSVALSGDQNLSTMDAVCAFNHGKLFTATTNKGLKRKLQRLIKNIRKPVAKNIVVKTISKNSTASVEISPLAPNLFLDQPYVIMGTVSNLDDCILFIQGQMKDRTLNIKKNLSFVHAKKGGNALAEEWAQQQAYRKYEQFLIDEDPKHLVDAREILEPFNLPSIR